MNELLAYQAIIAKASSKYKWPAWLVYDQNFRMDVAGNSSQSWARAICSMFYGPSLHSRELVCHMPEHLSRHSKVPLQKPEATLVSCIWSGASSKSPGVPTGKELCIKCNRYNGDCRYGTKCRYPHACNSCGESHPVTQCGKADTRRGE